MSDFDPIPSHYDVAVDELPSQLRRSRLLSLVEGLCEGAQVVENDALSVIEDTTIDIAIGDALKQYARLVGEPAEGISDIDLRRLVRARLLAARCSGTVDEILEVLSVASGAVRVVHYDLPPARAWLAAVVDAAAADVIRRRVGAIVRSVKPAGVSLTLVEAVVGYFGFAEDPFALDFDTGVFAREYT